MAIKKSNNHHILRYISSCQKEPTVIAKSLEKFTSMRIGRVEIKDSLQFMSSSLDTLVSDLKDKKKRIFKY